MIGAAIVLIFGTAPAALAGTDSKAYVCDSYCPAGTAYWHNYGDSLQACDNAPDGYAQASDNFSEGCQIPIRAYLGGASTNTIDFCGDWNHNGVT